MERALRIVRENIQPDEEIDSYTIFCYFAPCECKEMGIWFVGGGLCTRCDEIEYCCLSEDLLQRQLLANASTWLCKM